MPRKKRRRRSPRPPGRPPNKIPRKTITTSLPKHALDRLEKWKEKTGIPYCILIEKAIMARRVSF